MDDLRLLEDTNFTLNPSINGPLLATFVALETLLSLTVNLFILCFTISHYKILKQPANIFLTNFIVLNTGIALVQMLSSVITAATGEWMYNSSVELKAAFCYLVGSYYLFGVYNIGPTITAISVDQFLFIVKPSVHKHIMKTWIAILIIIRLMQMVGEFSTSPAR